MLTPDRMRHLVGLSIMLPKASVEMAPDIDKRHRPIGDSPGDLPAPEGTSMRARSLGPDQRRSLVPLRYVVEEARQVLRMSRTQLYNRIAEGAIAIQKDGSRTYILLRELERYVEACQGQEPKEPTGGVVPQVAHRSGIRSEAERAAPQAARRPRTRRI
jgi:hypothetical protein